MITREDLELVLDGFADETVGPKERAAYERVYEEFWSAPSPDIAEVVWTRNSNPKPRE